MKKLLCVLLLLFALTLPVLAQGEMVYIHPESHWLVMETGEDMQVLAAEYVIDFHRDEQTGTVYYTALEAGTVQLRAVQSDGAQHTIPLELEAGQLTLLSTPSQSTEKMVDAAMTIIYRNEGHYGSVNKDDNGALSIGKVQWHANRALNLLKSIVREAPDLSLELLGEELHTEIILADSWGSRTVNEEEKLAISALLKTEVGKAAQDALAATDITSYVNHALNLGLRSSTAIVYFADVENQWGYYGAQNQAKKAMEAAGSYEAVTLDILHQACLDYSSKEYIQKRRQKGYEYCLDLGWPEFAVLTPQTPVAQVAGTTVRLSWEPVEQAEGYECFVKVVQNGFVDVCSVETENTHCTVTLNADSNYCAYVVAKSRYSTSDSSLWAIFDTLLPRIQTTMQRAETPEGETQPVFQISCQLENPRDNHRILVAGYRQGRLSTFGLAAWNPEEKDFTVAGDLDEIRLLVVDGAFSWMPLCQAQVFDCTPPVEVPPEEPPTPETPVPEEPAPEPTPAE